MVKNASPPSSFSVVRLALAVLLTGVAAGLAAAALSWMIHFIEHLAFGQSEAQSRIVTEGTTPERRMGALLCAGLFVTLCWTWLQVKGRPVVGIKGAIAADTPARRRPPFFENTVHALLQIVAVGSGAPIGRELAPRELSSLFSGRICDRLGIDEGMRRLLIASGSAAGLAGVYQVPFAGAIFALEILLGRFTVTYGIVALAVSVIATVVARIEVTTDVFYVMGQLDGSVVTVLWSAVIGTLVGLPAAAFRRAVQHAEQYRAKGWDVLWALPLALLLTEVVAIWLPQVLGNGRSVAQTAYDGITIGMCLALIVGKAVVVLATLRGGAYGGTLQPAVALGALSGIVLGMGLHLLPVWAWLPASAAKADLHSAAAAGSAAFLAVSMNAPLTAFGLVMGFTGQHDTAALPLLASVSAAMGMASLWPHRKALPAQDAAAHHQAAHVAAHQSAQAEMPLGVAVAADALMAAMGSGRMHEEAGETGRAGGAAPVMAKQAVQQVPERSVKRPAQDAHPMGGRAAAAMVSAEPKGGHAHEAPFSGHTQPLQTRAAHDAEAADMPDVPDAAPWPRRKAATRARADAELAGVVQADVEQARMEKAGAGRAAARKTAAGKTAGKAAAEKAAAEKAAAEKAAAEKAATEKAAAEKATTEKATTEKATTEKAAAEKAAADKAAVVKAATEKAAIENAVAGKAAAGTKTTKAAKGTGSARAARAGSGAGDAGEKRAAPRRRTKATAQQDDAVVTPAQAARKGARQAPAEPVDVAMEVLEDDLADVSPAAKKRTKAGAGKSARKTTDASTGRQQTHRTVRQTEVRVSRQTAEETTIQWREQETRGPLALAAPDEASGQLAITWPGQDMALQPPGQGLPINAQALYLERERNPAAQQEARADVPTEIRVSVVISVPPGSRSAHAR